MCLNGEDSYGQPAPGDVNYAPFTGFPGDRAQRAHIFVNWSARTARGETRRKIFQRRGMS